MHSVLEQQRRALEAMDRLENLGASLLMDTPRAYKEKLTQQHRVSGLAKKTTETAQSLLTSLDDPNGLRKTELEKMSGANQFTDFYARLKEIKEYHRRFPDEPIEPMELEFMNAEQPPVDDTLLDSLFSGEELFGRFVDLHALHEQYVNLKDLPRHSYLAYLDHFADLAEIPVEAKNAQYKEYLISLTTYLHSFITRAQPMFNLDTFYQYAQAMFDDAWETRSVPGWTSVDAHLGSPDLYCRACQKQFVKEHVYSRHLTEKRHKKAAAALVSRPTSDADAEDTVRLAKRKELELQYRDVAWRESLVRQYKDHLAPVLAATKDNIERKQTLTESELLDELDYEDEPEEVDDDESDDEDKIYNPLKLPLGWDGKPIPYWLYKLHGLGVEYSCEICGNYVYMGRKAFERHFQEWRHAHGMRCLGIPNSKQFQEITKIEDAQTLWAKIQASQTKGGFRPEADEEFEDSEGNVLTRKTYEDLMRQGLL
ncbi:Splicing factor 3A subunit 3 [Allomyces arbusculus]|nr:Splicing factor 3A subunit 3 [Allomyces arbusculus]